MYLTAVDLSWEENVPTQIPTGKRTRGKTLASSFCPSLGSQGPLPCLGDVQGQGTGANLACFWEHRQTQPWPRASTPSQMDRMMDDRYRDKDAGSDQEFGEPRDTAVLWGSPSCAARASCPQGHCLEDSGAWAALISSHLLPRCPGVH